MRAKILKWPLYSALAALGLFNVLTGLWLSTIVCDYACSNYAAIVQPASFFFSIFGLSFIAIDIVLLLFRNANISFDIVKAVTAFLIKIGVWTVFKYLKALAKQNFGKATQDVMKERTQSVLVATPEG